MTASLAAAPISTAVGESSTHAATTGAATAGPTTAWRDGVWHVNTADAVRHDDVVLTEAPTVGQDSMPIGNGVAGAAVWGQNGFTAQLNRVDTMPDRRSAGWLTIPGLAALTSADDYSGVVDLYDATYRQSGGGMTATTYLRADKDELIVDVTGADPSVLQTATVDLQSGRHPQATADGAVGVLAETWKDTLSAGGGTGKTFGSLAALTASGADTTASTPTSNSVRIQFHPAADGSFRVVVGIPHYAGGDAAAIAQSVLGDDAAATSDQLNSAHLAWWHDYWQRANLIQATSADGDADYMANLRTIYLYEAASSERGEYPASQAGVNPLFNFSRDKQQWGGGHYWFWNLRMQLAANQTSGVSELNDPFFHMYSSDLPSIEQWTRQNYPGTQGICLPETMRFDGTGWYVGTQSTNASCHPSETSYNAKNQSSAAELASWIWRQYQQNDDKTFLAQYYPLIKEAAQFYLSVAKEGEDGKLHTFANAHESQWDVHDPITDIAAMKMLFPIAISATQKLDADDAFVAQLKAALPKILDFPRTDRATHKLLKTAADDGDGNTVLGMSSDPAATRRNSENLDLEPVWPYNLISDTSPLFGLAQTTYLNRVNRNSNSWTYDAVDAARLDMGDEVAADLHRQAASFSKYPSGLAAFSSDMSEPYDETNGDMALALNESLATDYDGLLRIAPAVPTGWDMAGTISLQHQSKVHVQVSGGVVSTVAIESGSNHEMKVRNPWPGEQIQVVDSKGRVVVTATDAETISFIAHTGYSYVVERVAHPTADQSFAPLGGSPAANPRQLAGASVKIGLGQPVNGATPLQATPVVTGTSPAAGQLKVQLENRAAKLTTVTSVSWTLGDTNGTQTLDTTIAAHSQSTVTVDVGSPTFGETYPIKVTSRTDSGVTSSALFGHVTFVPVVHQALGSSWSLADVRGGPGVTLGNWGNAGASEAPAGLGGTVWFNWDASNLYVTADVTDTNHSEPATGGNIWQGDSLQVAATTGVPGSSSSTSAASNAGHYEYGEALTPDGVQVWRWTAPSGQSTGSVSDAVAHVTRDDATGHTLYELALPWSDLTSVTPQDGTVFSISALLNDTDNGARLGFLQWGGGIGPSKDVAEFNMAQLMP